jgi:hypothetical protein
MRRLLLSAIAVPACWSASALASPSASAADVYSFANGCYALRDMTANRLVVREGDGDSTPRTVQRLQVFRQLWDCVADG